MNEKTMNEYSKVNRYTRASKYFGCVIGCPQCNSLQRVYHFSWSALICTKYKQPINKYDWEETNEQI